MNRDPEDIYDYVNASCEALILMLINIPYYNFSVQSTILFQFFAILLATTYLNCKSFEGFKYFRKFNIKSLKFKAEIVEIREALKKLGIIPIRA